MTEIITVKDLTKRYGEFTAVDGVSFGVQSGETFGILGPNGAGKTTTLEMLEGLKQMTSGSVRFDGLDVAKQTREVKHRIGVQLQSSTFFDGLSLVELLSMFGALYGRKIDAMGLLKQVQLEEKSKAMVKALSGGQKQRLSIAAALVNDPKAIFLDEPTTGLDPQARRNLWDLIERIKQRGTTIILTTHYMEEAEVLCDRIAIMDHAKIIALDTPYGLLKHADVGSTIEFKVSQPPPAGILGQLAGVTKTEEFDHAYKLLSQDPERSLSALFEAEAKYGFKLHELQLHQATLEDVFLKLTGRSLRD